MHSKQLRVLIVEDDEHIMQILVDKVERAGDYAVSTARSLGEARERLSVHPYDAVILDLGLPDSTGVSTLSRVLLASPETPVVVVTGLNGDEDLAYKCLSEGANEYLPKTELVGGNLERALANAIARGAGMRKMAWVLAEYLEKSRAR